MDFSTNIAAMSVSQSQNAAQLSASTKVMKMAMNQESVEAEAIQDMMPPASALNPAGLGANIDVMA